MDNKNKKSINEDVKFYNDGVGENSPEDYENKGLSNLAGTDKKKKENKIY
jgi:hypothetical protein